MGKLASIIGSHPVRKIPSPERKNILSANCPKTGKKIKDDLVNKSLKNESILPNQIAFGVLFFPGMPEEAHGVTELRLSLTMDEAPHVVKLKLTKE